LLALQDGPINQDQRVNAFRAGTRDSVRPMAEQFVVQGDLDADQHAVVGVLVALHLRKQGDSEKGLVAVGVGRSIRQGLAAVEDPEVHATLAGIGSHSADNGKPDGTPTLSAGVATSDGQQLPILHPYAWGGFPRTMAYRVWNRCSILG